jgi:hypothetical protein
MKELTKGTLVMTDMGLAWYIKPARAGVKLYNHEIELLQSGYSYCQTISIATRAQVEEKIKEMGWVWEDAYASWDKPSNLYKVLENIPNNWGLIVPSTIIDTDFDTAPAQLAEAILVAKLLNATKD